MKLSFNKSDLLDAVQTVQSSVSTKSTLPILSNFLIQVDKSAKGSNQKIRLEATDLEVGIRCTVKGEIVKDGKITVPAKKFSDLIKEMPADKEIEISSGDGKRIELKCGKVKASMMALSPEDFPVIPEFLEAKSFKLSRAIFREMIRKTSFAVSMDETRYVLNGVCFFVHSGEIRMIATDGRRLAFMSKPGAEQNLDVNVIIPSKAIAELQRLLSLSEEQGEDLLQISPHENQISFKWQNRGEEIVLVSRVIDGTFPNYEQVIPKGKDIEVKVKTSDMLAAVRRAALFTQDRSGSVKMSIGKGFVRVSANSQGVGEEEEELETNYAGPDFEIAFNPAFLLDALKNNDSAEVRFEFTSALNPGLIKPMDNDKYLCVIMPMRLQ